MTSQASAGYEIDVQDVEYLRHGDRPLLARLYSPRGDGPFPMIVDLHGGAWCRGGRTHDAVMDEPLALSGVAVAALDSRTPPDAPCPGPLIGIRHGLRWLQSRATGFRGCCTCRAIATWRGRGGISAAASRATERGAARSPSSCWRARPRATSAASRPHPRSSGRSPASSSSSTNSSARVGGR